MADDRNRGRESLKPKHAELVGVQGLAYGRIRFLAKFPDGRGHRPVELDVDGELLVAIARHVRGCPQSYEEPSTGRRPETMEEALSDPRYVFTEGGHAIWHMDHPERLMPCLPVGTKVLDVGPEPPALGPSPVVIDALVTAPALGPLPDGRKGAP